MGKENYEERPLEGAWKWFLYRQESSESIVIAVIAHYGKALSTVGRGFNLV